MHSRLTVLGLGLAILAISLAHGCDAQERITGRPRITDGDSFSIDGTEIRLFGIDAPEGRQSCTRDDREWRCGDAATDKLRGLIGSAAITCVRRDVDDYGRIVAECRRGNLDLAAEMARAGFAVAYRRYSNAYVDEENEARAARRGLWAGEFTRPDEWRRAETAPRATPSASAARRDGCNIKGNINSSGAKIYHTPGSPSYRDTEIDERRGEQWFCTESEARRAGFRAPRPR